MSDKDDQMLFRCSAEEKKEIKLGAKLAGFTSVSEWIRQTLLKAARRLQRS